MRRWGDEIKANKEDLAALCTLELGKPYTESLVTVNYAIDFIDWFEGAVERTFGETIPAFRGNNRILTIREPQGVVACITPWNSPVAMVTRKVGAAIAAGNTVVCKPAPETPLCTIALAKLFERAGGPPGVFNIVNAGPENTPSVGQELCSHPAVKHLSFTGSTAVGRLLNTECAKTIKKTSLELGGNAPFIVFEDADLDKAVAGGLYLGLTDFKLANPFQGSLLPSFDRPDRRVFVLTGYSYKLRYWRSLPRLCRKDWTAPLPTVRSGTEK